MMSGPQQFTQPQFTGLGAMLEFYHKPTHKPKTVPNKRTSGNLVCHTREKH